MTRRTVLLCAILLLFPVLGQVRADKLVVFHNGRTLRATEVRQDGEWSFLTLGKGSEMGVPNRLISAINEVKASAGTSLPNVQASAGGAASGSAGSANLRRSRPVAAAVGARPVNTGVRHQAPQGHAAQARRDALRRAASQAYSQAPTPSQPRATRAGQPPAGVNLSQPGASAQWPSLLGQGRSARRPRGKGKGKNDR